jgi:alcohol dehydrogenase, propanol-preferring
VALLGSNGGTKEDVASIYRHLANGDLDPAITTIGFDDIPEGLERLDRGEVVGRLVAEFGG